MKPIKRGKPSVPDDFKGSAVRCKHFVSTADVAPRAEVAREIFAEIEGALECAYDSDQQSDYPIPCYHEYLKDDIAELKKKYTGE